MKEIHSTEPVVIVVDDDEPVRNALKRSVGFAAETVSSAEDLPRSTSRDNIKRLIHDVHVPAVTGLEIQRRLGSVQCRIPIIFYHHRPGRSAGASSSAQSRRHRFHEKTVRPGSFAKRRPGCPPDSRPSRRTVSLR